ncbi:c-type cytochrome [Novosphingobium resinovorum]|uniref:c-type cytochrome n=1 Tax=Novosphingobium resinovorum TaxID=158500 RepID=UPI002ED38EF4|nr:c-type cytochrome [Novosphingobium resinovorum]
MKAKLKFPIRLALFGLPLAAIVAAGFLSSAVAADQPLVAKGKTAFAACAACHGTAPGVKKVGPTLFGIVGRKAGTAPGLKASPALANSGKVWTPDQLDAFITAPRKAVPGNRMPYPGMANPEQRKALIAYLATLR